MQTASQIIKALGGPSKVAAETGIPLTTVHSWTRSNSIPDWRRDALLALARKADVPLSADGFPPPEARITAPARAA